MKTLSAAIILFLSFGLSGCGGDTVAVDEPREDYRPELRAFDIVDTYGSDTAVPGYTPLVFDPYAYDGVFEAFWDVDSIEDYRVTLRVNVRATIAGSIPVVTQLCGAGRQCDQSGTWVCEYTASFFMACGDVWRDVDISPLVTRVPQRVYLFIEICDIDSGYCEFDYYPVTLE